MAWLLKRESILWPLTLSPAPLSQMKSFKVMLVATFNYITRGRTNAMISNNSWNYPDSQEYGLSAASFDAAST